MLSYALFRNLVRAEFGRKLLTDLAFLNIKVFIDVDTIYQKAGTLFSSSTQKYQIILVLPKKERKEEEEGKTHW